MIKTFRFFFLILFFIIPIYTLKAQNKPTINIHTEKGHAIKRAASGFNVRIADKSWSYKHPDFRKAVHELKPGWLRYFSGTMGDAFSSATGLYDLDYAMMFDHTKQYIKGYNYTDIKGPHRLIDLYQLLGEINGKLIITVNGFTETPEMTRELARFCKNNHIEVATWQFCNEPYFYVPHRERYWWNDGYDYAKKMKPHADAIKEIFPDAYLALNCTWDGIWDFMKEINHYQNEHGAYWNVFSKHSYAPHTGKKETLEEAYRRGNTKLLEATSNIAMKEIENYTWQDVPMVITEFGIWNTAINGIYSSIYNIEYAMRQLEHTNTWYVGAHEVSSKYRPKKNINEQIESAFQNNQKLNTDAIATGIDKTLEGKAYQIYHKATNNSDYIFQTSVNEGFYAPGMKKTTKEAFYTQAYRGVNGYNYIVFTNRSKDSKTYAINIDGKLLNKTIETQFITADSLQVQNTNIQEKTYEDGTIHIPSYSVTVAKWKSTSSSKPTAPIIYNAEIKNESVKLNWGRLENVKHYTLFYGNDLNNLKKKSINKKLNTIEIDHLEKEKTYYFQLAATNKQGTSELSNLISLKNGLPENPQIFKTSRRNNTATIFWKSVANSSSYLLKYVNTITQKEEIINTDNVYGFRVKNLEYDTPYLFSIAAKNGLGTSAFSPPVTLSLSEKVPFSPRNVSAMRDTNEKTTVKWIAQKDVLPETTYTIYRGKQLHDFHKIAEQISTLSYIDTTAKSTENYFYTVKAENSAGESNFYPNIATLISSDDAISISLDHVEEQSDGYLIQVKFKNIKLDGDCSYGVKLENISYLTVEEQLVEGKNLSKDHNSSSFEVFIPYSELNKKSKYAIKAYINTNGKYLYSKLPNKTIKTQ